jgi:iron-sulfur cluster repair protein YtfE (RIC family)
MAAAKKTRSKKTSPRKKTAPLSNGKAAPRRNGTDHADAPDAIRLLELDHRQVEALFAAYDAASRTVKKRAIAREISDALTAHMRIEEEIFYPQARKALKSAGYGLVDEAELEHEGIRMRIAELKKTAPGHRYDATVKVLREYVEHHVKDEEHDFFPKVKRTRLDLDRVGAELAARKEQLTGKPVESPPNLVHRGLQALGLESRPTVH